MKLLDWEGPLPEESTEEYHQREAYSSTQIKEMRKSPRHFKSFVIDGIERSTAALERGQNSHQFVHEGNVEQFKKMPDFVAFDVEVPGAREGTTKKKKVTIKEQKQKFLEENSDKTFLTETEYDKLIGMREAYLADPLVQSMLSPDDIVEQGYLFYDEKMGVDCRFRPDRLSQRLNACIDYKTTSDATFERFKWSMHNYAYHISAAHYMLGLNRLFGDKYDKFIFIVQETTAPYACAVYKLSDEDMLMGIYEREILIAKIKECKATDTWPGYTENIVEIQMPRLKSEVDDEIATFESVNF